MLLTKEMLHICDFGGEKDNCKNTKWILGLNYSGIFSVMSYSTIYMSYRQS